jgi:DNA-binding MarR family transcriptional regulator
VRAETESIERYLHDTLGLTARLDLWTSSERLPIYLRDGFRFYQTTLLDTPCLLMVDRAEEAPSPATVRKQMDQVQPKWEGELIYVRPQVASHQRRRLIEQRVPFLVPGNQLYLPMLGIDLREHFRKQQQTPLTFKPATQALVLQLLLGREGGLQSPVEFAERLGYTKMTMSRAFDELEAEQLCDVSKEGRERQLRLKDTRPDLWKAALPLLRSPVRQRKQVRWYNHGPKAPIAGLSALAKRSMLAPPEHVVYAFSKDQFEEQRSQYERLPAKTDDPNAVGIEIWHYDPQLFAKTEIVDPFSLYLSLRDDEDERVQASLQKMMEGLQWS